MADDDKPRPKRPPSIMGDAERAEIGRAARSTPRSGVPVTSHDDGNFNFEDNSKNYEGDDLRRFRESKTPLERLARVEEKSDARDEDIKEIRTDVKNVVSSNATVVGELRAFMSMQPRTTRRRHTDALALVAQQAAKTEAIALVAQQAAKTTLADRVLDEQDKTKKFRRTFILSTLKLLSLIISAGGGGALIHWLLGRHP
jgi:hypothetical protein